jgi:hypothetical protein
VVLRRARLAVVTHLPPLLLLAALSLLWTWPLPLHFRDHIPGLPGDNFSFLWNLWWMRTALSAPELDFFRSTYLFSPFGVDLINHPHTALQGFVTATVLAPLSIIEAENLYILVSVFLNAACAYALAFDLVPRWRLALLAGVAFGGSPYVAAHLSGHFDLLTAWVVPLFALCLRRSLRTGGIAPAVGCGLSVAVTAYAAYYHVVYLALFAVTYVIAAADVVSVRVEPRSQRSSLFTVRLVLIGLMTLDVFVIAAIALTGGTTLVLGGTEISARTVQNPLFVLWLLALGWGLTRWRAVVRFRRVPADAFWRAAQTLMVTVATFVVLSLPLVVQAFRIAVSGRYVSQTYFWRSAPRGIDAVAPFIGNPFHPLYGESVSGLYARLGLDRIEAVGWIGVVPVLVLLARRGTWSDPGEARRWKAVLVVFALWALGPFLTVAGFDVGLPLPEALARFVPLVENARMPGRAIVGVYLALGVLMVLRLAGTTGLTPSATGSSVPQPSASVAQGSSPGYVWALIALLAFDYLHAPIPLTRLDRPAVYEQLATIQDNGAVIEVPFGIGDGLSAGIGSQDRRLLYNATIHGHPVVGGYIGRMPPNVAAAYDEMPVVGNLLRLSNGEEALPEPAPSALPFRYLVLDTTTASPQVVEYLRHTLDMDLIASGDGKELYAVQGTRPANLRASR